MRAKWQLSWTAPECGRAICVTLPGILYQRTPTVWSQQEAAPTAGVTRDAGHRGAACASWTPSGKVARTH